MPMSYAAYEYLWSVDDPQEAQKKRIKTGRANEVALSQLNVEFDTANIINMINDCTTMDWPNVLSHMLVKNLGMNMNLMTESRETSLKES